MRTSHKIAIATTLGSVATLTALAASLGTSAPQPSHPEGDDPVVFARAFYARVLSGDQSVCAVFTAEGRRDFVTDMQPATGCPEAVEVLGNAVGADHLAEFTRSHTYALVSHDEDKAVVRADFGPNADLMDLHWVDGEWRVGPTTSTTAPLASE